ncbi:hypothetical protein DKK66_20025 (plasmid) [Aquitalea sp. USM4]|nr:hypothetical protein DKK66_20025 [Aquitalea sp. USM4]
MALICKGQRYRPFVGRQSAERIMQMAKNIEVKVYLTPEQYVVVKEAAEMQDRSVSAFLRVAGSDLASEVLQQHADKE